MSPYLNLLNPGGSLTSNYYNLYRPQQDFRRFQREATSAARDLSSSINSQRTELDELRRSNLSATGAAASFMTHGQYFRPR